MRCVLKECGQLRWEEKRNQRRSPALKYAKEKLENLLETSLEEENNENLGFAHA